MTRIASTLYVREGGARVGADKNALIVRSPSGSRSRVPLDALDGVVLIGGSSITSVAIDRCVAAGVRVASLTRSGRIRFVCHPATSGNVHLRVAQVNLSQREAEKCDVSKVVVAGKLRNSVRLVRRWSTAADEPERSVIVRSIDGIERSLDKVVGARTADHLRGLEGEAARWYFKAMGAHLAPLGPPFGFPRRSRQPPADPVNAAISFGYGLLCTELIGAADAVGLDPQVGLFHGIRSGRPALALDVIEEFRSQIVDRHVVGALRRRSLRLEHFVETPGGGWYLTDEGRRHYIEQFEQFRDGVVDHDLLGRTVPRWSLSLVQMTVMARFLRGDLPGYVPWQGG